MAAVYSLYIDELWSQERSWAAWPPDTRVDLGDVGWLRGHIFERVASVKDFGASLDVRSDTTASVRRYATKSSIDFSVKLKGVANPGLFPNVSQGEFGLRLGFRTERAVVYAFLGCRQDAIANYLHVVRTLKAHPEWDDKYFLVSQVVSADSGTVIIAESKGSHIEFGASADVAADIATLAKVDIGLQRRGGSQASYEMIGGEGLTPLFVGGYISGRYNPQLPGDDIAASVIGDEEIQFREFTPRDAGVAT